MSGYVSSGRLMMDHHKDVALEYWRFARVLLRWGARYEHRQMMHEAVRSWRNFKHYQRKLGNANR